MWELGGGAVGANDLVPPAPPLVSADRRHHLWGVGEIFSGLVGVPLPATLQDPAVRRALLRALLHDGAAALAHVNGEFQVALWDEVEGTLLLAADRFGCVPIYWTLTPGRFVFGPTVDQLLPVPGVGTAPDEDAIREAVTFGGFRLADRTSVRGVRMLRGGRVLVLENGAVTERRYWKWPPPPEPTTRTLDLLVQEAYERWQGAIRRRLHGAARPGGTLSGGLDSRAIMAEARAQGATWRALTYGIPRCDDARLARRAAAAAGAEWRFAALYEGDWLARRTTYVAQTDGLVQLADLMHFETLPQQVAMMDVHLSGYVGDVVCGDTYGDVADPATLLSRMPYSGVPLAWTRAEALAWAEAALADVAPGDARFAIFEHKLPQAIHRIFQAAQGQVRVRRPFLDHDLFDFFATLDARTRARVYHEMLRREYPALFRRIAHQRTNAPVLANATGVQVRRIARYAGRRVRDAVARTGVISQAPSRSYHDEERYWREPAVRSRICGTILRAGSLTAEIFGRRPLAAFLDAWFERGSGPAQVVGALYVFEHYHANRAARARAATLAAV